MHTTQDESTQKGIDNKYILASLYFRDFLEKSGVDSPQIKEYLNCISTFSEHYPSSLVAQVTSTVPMSVEEQQLLLEAQLRWEQQISKLTPDKKIASII